MAHILLTIVLFDNLKVWLDRPFNFLCMHNASQFCNASHYGLKIAKFSSVQNGCLSLRVLGIMLMRLEKTPRSRKVDTFLKLTLAFAPSTLMFLALPTYSVKSFRYNFS